MARVKEQWLAMQEAEQLAEWERQAQAELDLDRDVLEMMREFEKEKWGY